MELKYIVYITINLCNGKIYIGVHRTNPNVFDGYIGCGIYRESNIKPNCKGFPAAVLKYGYENFRRTTIKCFPDDEAGKQDAYNLEKILVNETFLKSKNVYNLGLGGYGGLQLEESKKRIYKFDLKGNFLKSYDCVDSAARELNQEDLYTTKKAIRNNCLGTSQSSFGFYWSYIKKFDYQESKVLIKVSQYTYSGKFIRYFDSRADAERELKLNSIDQAISKKGLCGGFQWRIFNGDFSDIPSLVNLKNKNKVIPIKMFDKNMTLLKSYNCVEECIKENPDLSTAQINRVLTNVIKSHKGFIFTYKEDEDIVLTE